MSELDPRSVRHGVWTNVDHGQVLGRTITTDIKTGTIVVSLMTLLSSLAITHLWNLTMFLTHQIRAKGGSADGLFRQQQAILRAAPPPGTLLLDWLNLYWTWRKTIPRAFQRSSIHPGLAIFFLCGLVSVSTFSSYVVDGTNLEVLVQSHECAPLNVTKLLADQNMQDLYSKKVQSRSKRLSQDCWQPSQPLPIQCRTFLQPNIPLQIQKTACPFRSLCHAGDFGVVVDSGLIDTSQLFGWNVENGSRVRFRRKTTCGILQSKERQSVSNTYPYALGRKKFPGEEFLFGYYGHELNDTGTQNISMGLSLLKSNMSNEYSVGSHRAWANPQWNSPGYLVPLPEMTNTDADVSVIYLWPHSVKYALPVDDPLFSAHKIFQRSVNGARNITTYISDWPASVLGCWEQWQFCLQRDNQSDFCTPLAGLPSYASPNIVPGATDVQVAAIQLLIDIGFLYHISNTALAVLNASDHIQDQVVGLADHLPPDQWMQEIVGWEQFTWALFQISVSDYSLGYANQVTGLEQFQISNISQGAKDLCQLQRRLITGDLVNINVFGLAFIVSFASFILILDFFVLKFAVFVERIRRGSPRVNRWIQDGVLQLQRRAYEAANQGSWTNHEKPNPFTLYAEELRELPISSRHPDCEGTTRKEANFESGETSLAGNTIIGHRSLASFGISEVEVLEGICCSSA